MTVDNIGVQADGLRQLSRDLRKLADGGDLRKRLRSELKAAAEPVAAQMRRETSWSSRIPASVRVGVTQRGVYVRAGGPKAPHAAAYEGANGQQFFRHPVFGNRSVWVDQPTRPFALRSLQAHESEIVDRAADAIEKAFRTIDFR